MSIWSHRTNCRAHRAKSMDIPQDIIDNVIAAVGDSDDKCLLKQCALVSSSFLRPSRKQLFSRITLRSDRTCQGIHQFLVQNPVIQSFVRTITLMDSWGYMIPEWMNGTSLLAILRLPFSCLECFSIIVHRDFGNRYSWDWNSFSSELKDALSNIILHSSSLKTLSLRGIAKVPITFFLRIVHLTTLELHSLSPNDFGDENSSSLAQAAPKGVAPTASHTVIDRCVWHFRKGRMRGTRFPLSAYFSLIQDREGPTESIFLPFMCRLRFFKIYIDLGSATMYDFDILSLLMGSLRISLTSPATLEHLEFNIWFRGFSNNFDTYRFYDDLRNAEVWSHLDSIITQPTGSRIQRVDICINYSFRYDAEDEEPDEDRVMEAVLDGLPSLRTKGILFVKAILAEWRGMDSSRTLSAPRSMASGREILREGYGRDEWI